MGYELTWHGILVYRMSSEATIAPDFYRLGYSGTTLGLFDLLIDYRSHAEAAGRLANGTSRPEHYRLDARWHGERRQAVLDYGPDGQVATHVVPPPESEDIDPVPLPMRENTVDPLSAALLVGIDGGQDGAELCAGTTRVFDGRQRYDMKLENLGRVELPKGERSAYSGPALKCRVTVLRLAGFSQGSFAEPQRPPTLVWLARVARNKIMLPVKIEIDTGLGAVDGTLTRLEIAGDGDRPKAP